MQYTSVVSNSLQHVSKVVVALHVGEVDVVLEITFTLLRSETGLYLFLGLRSIVFNAS